MNFLKDKELLLKNNLEKINQKILNVQKNLFNLRLKKAKNEKIQTHLFKKLKSELAQLEFHKYLLLKS